MSNTASSTPQHTPTPWEASRRTDAIVVDSMPEEFQHPDTVKHYGGYVVAESLSPEDRAFTLRAVNSHDQLVAALREIVRPYGIADVAVNNSTGQLQDEFLKVLRNVRAALTAAGAA